MKISKLFSALFGVVAVVLAVFTVRLSFQNIGAEPVLLSQPDSAHEQVVEMMDAFCAGDYAAAQKKFYGTTELGMEREPEDEVGVLIWDAFQSSMSYELVGELYATDSGLSQNIRITTMDISAITAELKDTVKPLLEERVLNAEDTEEIYDENREYRDEFVEKVLCEATENAIAANTSTVETELTLNLVYANGQWWVVASDGLLKAVSGGIV